MITSISKEFQEINIPFYDGSIKMLSFYLEDLSRIPAQFKGLVEEMISGLPIKKGLAYFTVDGKLIKKGESHRRPGVHIDGNFLPSQGWDSGGWKIGGGGKVLSESDHLIAYESNTGGLLIASTHPACKGWNGLFEGRPSTGGDCAHINITGNGFIMNPNVIYYGNSQFLHESVPVDKDVHRTLVRITLPVDYPVINA